MLHSRAFLLLILLAGCCFIAPAEKTNVSPNEQTRLEETNLSHPRGAIVIAHGLNQRPSSMEPLASFFRAHGYHTLRLTLAGHDTPTNEPFPSSVWPTQIRSAFQALHSRYPHLPVLYLGYSMSGLAAIQAIESASDFSPNQMILIAPAISLRTIIESARFVRWLPATTLSVRNLAPQAYRRYPRTPLFWYQNVAEMYLHVQSLTSPARARSIPTLLFVNPRDELVSHEGITSWISDNQLSERWKLSIIRPHTPDPRLAEHLLIDERSLGTESWQKMQQEILSFLDLQ